MYSINIDSLQPFTLVLRKNLFISLGICETAIRRTVLKNLASLTVPPPVARFLLPPTPVYASVRFGDLVSRGGSISVPLA